MNNDSKKKLETFFSQIPEIVKEVFVRELTILGEECVSRIRKSGRSNDWVDRTGNLRSSIGYAIYDDGKKIAESVFETVLQGSKGSSEGKRFVEEIAKDYSDTYALVVVAGMNYASYVEATGRDVLESTKLKAQDTMNALVERAEKRIESRITDLVKRLGLD